MFFWVQIHNKNCNKTAGIQKNTFIVYSLRYPKLLFHVINWGLFIKLMGCSLCMDYNNVNLTFQPDTGICDHSLVGHNPFRHSWCSINQSFFSIQCNYSLCIYIMFDIMMGLVQNSHCIYCMSPDKMSRRSRCTADL